MGMKQAEIFPCTNELLTVAVGGPEEQLLLGEALRFEPGANTNRVQAKTIVMHAAYALAVTVRCSDLRTAGSDATTRWQWKIGKGGSFAYAAKHAEKRRFIFTSGL